MKSSSTDNSNEYDQKAGSRLSKNKAEIIAWALFFGIGVAYFVAAMIIAIV